MIDFYAATSATLLPQNKSSCYNNMCKLAKSKALPHATSLTFIPSKHQSYLLLHWGSFKAQHGCKINSTSDRTITKPDDKHTPTLRRS